MTDTIQTVSEIVAEFDMNFDRINWGGCGVMAAILAEYLPAYFTSVDIVVYNESDDGDTHLDDLRANMDSNCIDEWHEQGLYFTHVWCEVVYGNERFAVDSEGIRPVEDIYDEWGVPLGGSFTVDEMRELGDEPTWNPSFDRDQIPDMKQMAAELFEEVA